MFEQIRKAGYRFSSEKSPRVVSTHTHNYDIDDPVAYFARTNFATGSQYIVKLFSNPTSDKTN